MIKIKYLIMNKILFILILSISLSTYSQQTIDQHNKRFDVIHYNLSLDIFNCFISPYVKSFKGIETIDVEATDTLTYIKLNSVNSSIEIDSVSGPINNFIDTNDTLIIFLNKIFQAGENFICTVYYKHKDTEDNAYFVKDGMVFTSNAPEGARCWFPCYDHPSDKATFELLAIVPENVFLCSNGLLIDSTMVNDTIFYHWKSDFPMATYLMNISAKRDYKLDKFYLKNPAANNDSVEIRFYWNEGEDINRLKYIEQAVQEMMNYYSEMFGKYPFRKIGFATLNDQFFYGGMENQTIINLCTDCWKEDLVAHEFAHQWFGDLITCESWADIWLNESFAEFCESLWIEHTKGNDAYKTNILKESVKYFLNNPSFPIVNKEWKFKTPPANQLYNSAVIYSKGACVLDMLRYVLGDSIFFGAINFYITNDIYKYGSITTEEFINLVNS